jgi:cell division septal protein FtsQ
MRRKKIFYFIGFLSFLLIFLFRSDIKFFFDKKLPIKDIEISGYKIIKIDDIENFIQDSHKKENLFFFDIWDLQKKMISHPLAENVEIKKIYPDRLSIFIMEKDPILLISEKKKNYILDRDGKITEIDQNLIKKYSEISNLLKIEGDEILDESHEIAKIFLDKNYTRRIVGLYKIGGRRWDVIIDYKVKVMLPEKITESFIDYTFNTIDKLKINNDIHQNAIYSIVDMRINNRIFIKNIDE